MKTLARITIMMVSVFIDLLKLFFSLAFLGLGSALNALTPAGGAAGGAVIGAIAGCYVTANHALDIIGCAIGALGGGALGAAVGAIAGSIGAPVGAVMGEIVDYCIAISGIASLTILLWWNGLFYPTIVFGGFTANLLPFINELPFEFTFMSWRCIARKMAEEGSLIAGVATAATALAQGNITGAATAAAGVAAQAATPVANNNQSGGANDNHQETRPHTERPQMHDIHLPKPANDNHPQPRLKAA